MFVLWVWGVGGGGGGGVISVLVGSSVSCLTFKADLRRYKYEFKCCFFNAVASAETKG